MRPTKVFFEILKAIKDDVRVIALKGSARSSKTVSAIQVLDFVGNFSAQHKKISITSQTFPHLRDGVIYEYRKHLMRDKLNRAHNKSEHEFTIYKSAMNYFSTDDPAKAIGPGRNILYCNEINKGMTREMYMGLKDRTTDFVMFDWNPSGTFFIHDKDGGEPAIIEDSRTRVIHSTWLDNLPNLSPAQIQDFLDAKRKSKTSDFWNYYWRVFGLGEDAVLLDERVMPFLNKCSKVPEDAVEIPSALDFGWYPNPTSFCRLWVRKVAGKQDELYIQQVLYSTKLSINAKGEGVTNLTEMLIAKGVNPLHQIIAESADPRAVNDMRAAKFNIIAVNKTNIESSIRLFHDYKIFIVDSTDGNDTFSEFDNLKYKRDAKNNLTNIPDPKLPDHSIDGTRYVLLSRNRRWSVN